MSMLAGMVNIREIGKEHKEISDILKAVSPSNHKTNVFLGHICILDILEALDNRFMHDTQLHKQDYLGILTFCQKGLWQ